MTRRATLSEIDGKLRALLNEDPARAIEGARKLLDGDADLRSLAAGAFGPGHAMLLCALDYALGPVYDVAIVGETYDGATQALLGALRGRFLPNKALILVNGDEVRGIARFTKEMARVEGRATAYVCSGHKCQWPTTDPDRMIDLLEDRLHDS